MSPQVSVVQELLEEIGFPEYVQRFLDMGYDRRVVSLLFKIREFIRQDKVAQTLRFSSANGVGSEISPSSECICRCHEGTQQLSLLANISLASTSRNIHSLNESGEPSTSEDSDSRYRKRAYLSHRSKKPRTDLPVTDNSSGFISTVSSSQDADVSEFEDGSDSPTSSEPPPKKRKYCRRPKPDPNAPKHPLNAYVLFCRELRQKGENLSGEFGARSKSCSELWRALEPHDQQKYEEASRKQREWYRKAMASYKKTPDYIEYQEYLKTFQETVPNAKPRPGRPGRKEKNN
ncbi:hypothetical protein IWQ62_004374 [Dispira parvispora]|uniref:HMG box domain-containing protein n=1 Tax=Dispira parvispora TaxID=1520584 RepID=A0A9W8AM19_9FUNG|nr:hypothetical protein IWQ62_004374 [Dispira parvispora]